MAVDPSISMNLATPDTATGIQNANQQRNQNEAQANSNAMAAEQVLQKHYEALDTREKSRLSSTIAGAVQLKQFIDSGDLPGAQNFLEQRKQSLQTRIAHGENVDTQETDYALNALRTGNLQELKNGIDGLVAAGQVYGILGSTGNPYIDQFKEVKKAHPGWTDAQVQDYVYTRGNVGKGTIFDQNGQVVNQAGAVNAAAQKAGAEAFATGSGTAAGKEVITNNSTLGNLSNMKQAVDAARQQLTRVSATGPIFGRAGDAAKDPEYINLQRNLNEITLLAKDLYNLGSGQGFTDTDREFLKELAGGSYNRAESISYALDRFDQALASRASVLNNQNQQYQQQYGAGANQPPQQPAAGVTPSGQKVRITNGKETYMIDPADLPAAQAEGFQQR